MALGNRKAYQMAKVTCLFELCLFLLEHNSTKCIFMSTASGAQASSTTPSHQTTSTAVSDRNNNSSPSVAMATHHSTEPPERRADELESQRVTALSAIYPQYSREELYEILKTVDFSLDAAIDILAE